MKYGFYSESCDHFYGHVVWSSPEGKQIKVCFVTEDPLLGYYKFRWQDKQFVGPITKVIKRERGLWPVGCLYAVKPDDDRY